MVRVNHNEIYNAPKTDQYQRARFTTKLFVINAWYYKNSYNSGNCIYFQFTVCIHHRYTPGQAYNKLGTSEVAKSFLRGAHIF